MQREQMAFGKGADLKARQMKRSLGSFLNSMATEEQLQGNKDAHELYKSDSLLGQEP